jgi:hypothetical protein
MMMMMMMTTDDKISDDNDGDDDDDNGHAKKTSKSHERTRANAAGNKPSHIPIHPSPQDGIIPTGYYSRCHYSRFGAPFPWPR